MVWCLVFGVWCLVFLSFLSFLDDVWILDSLDGVSYFGRWPLAVGRWEDDDPFPVSRPHWNHCGR